MKIIFKVAVLLFLISCSSTQQQSTRSINKQSATMITSWNKKIIESAIKEDGLLTLKGVRTAAMLHIAMHDALNNVVPQFEVFVLKQPDSGAEPITAMVEAAFTIANTFYPDSAELWLSEKKRWTQHIDQSTAQKKGIALGKAVAQAVIRSRNNDRWNSKAEYLWHPMAPGVYAEFNEHSGTPKGFIFGAGWANVKPFALTSNKQFVSPPPPDISSNEYTQAFNEVKQVGRFKSSVRTPDQTHLALWWKDFAEKSHNKLARELSQQQNLGLAKAARLFALLNISIFDAYVDVFYNKFLYNHWRPYTAIRWASHDGNPDTIEDLSWTNTHQHTYAFPSYPSAHGTACTAAMTVMADVFGNNLAFKMTTKEVDKAGPFSGKMSMNPETRSFNHFSDAAMECSMSRVYLGIHFRYDSIEGNKLGAKIGNFIVTNYMRKLRE